MPPYSSVYSQLRQHFSQQIFNFLLLLGLLEDVELMDTLHIPGEAISVRGWTRDMNLSTVKTNTSGTNSSGLLRFAFLAVAFQCKRGKKSIKSHQLALSRCYMSAYNVSGNERSFRGRRTMSGAVFIVILFDQLHSQLLQLAIKYASGRLPQVSTSRLSSNLTGIAVYFRRCQYVPYWKIKRYGYTYWSDWGHDRRTNCSESQRLRAQHGGRKQASQTLVMNTDSCASRLWSALSARRATHESPKYETHREALVIRSSVTIKCSYHT